MDDIVVGSLIRTFGGPLADCVYKVAGPFSEELGLLLRDKIRMYRLKNLQQILEMMRRILADAEVEASPVPPRLLLPIIESASVEDDEMMQELWAHLLASAAQEPDAVPPSFVEILKQLSPQEAQFLTQVYGQTLPIVARVPFTKPEREFTIHESLTNSDEWLTFVDSFERLGVVAREFDLHQESMLRVSQPFMVSDQGETADGTSIHSSYRFTRLGINFMNVCTGKEPGFAYAGKNV